MYGVSLRLCFTRGYEQCRKIIRGYRELLRDEETFSSFDLSETADAWSPLAGSWFQEFGRRYLALDLSEDDCEPR